MDTLISRVWDSVYAGAQLMHNNDGNLKINTSKSYQEAFEKNFMELYEGIQKNYMKNCDEPLDRHKVAAIVMISIIKCNILEVENNSNTEKTFMGNYILATNCGLAYMLTELNRKLENLEKDKIKKFFYPQAMACETDYYRIFYRNLYFTHTNKAWGLNPLDIAERLFLLEYMTLEKNNIEPSILKEY